MSVIQIDPTEFGKIASTLLWSRYADDFLWCVFDTHENAETRALLSHLEPNEFNSRCRESQTRMITAWVDRLYLANQIAAALVYVEDEEFTLRHLPVELLHFPPHTVLPEFYEMLRFVRYNLYTNAGRCMFSYEDMSKLDELINVVASYIIQDLIVNKE